MRIMTLAKYLLGRRAAIEEMAAHPASPGIGLLFVLGAGVAREYDQEYLLREPWHALLPLAVSTAMAIVVATVFWCLRPVEGTRRPCIVNAWRLFLACFWMMAPMAWLYAIPYERFLTAGQATRANLWTLALVAAWRVGLMTRVLVVILRVSPVAAFMLVMFFADVLALIAISVVPAPIFNVMGGIRLNESAGMIASAAFTVQILGVLSLVIWGPGALVALITMRPDWRIVHADADEASLAGECSHGGLALAGGERGAGRVRAAAHHAAGTTSPVARGENAACRRHRRGARVHVTSRADTVPATLGSAAAPWIFARDARHRYGRHSPACGEGFGLGSGSVCVET
jgi:hypothetical protein